MLEFSKSSFKKNIPFLKSLRQNQTQIREDVYISEYMIQNKEFYNISKKISNKCYIISRDNSFFNVAILRNEKINNNDIILSKNGELNLDLKNSIILVNSLLNYNYC